jgi:putative hemolysin
VLTTELAIIFLLLVANGIFAMSEIAVVSSRRVRLEQRAQGGDRRAGAALRLKDEPAQFLSTVQIGITGVGIFAGAYSGATFIARLSEWLTQYPAVAPYSEQLALAVVVSAITYASLVIGELVPKAIALTNPERIAGYVARPVSVVARIGTPVVKLLTVSTSLVLRVLRVRPTNEPGVTEEEIRALLKQAALSGDVEPVEHAIVEKVFRLGDRRATAIMTPRHEVDWIDMKEGMEGVRQYLAQVRHPRLLVCDGELDKVVGIAFAEDLLDAALSGRPVDLRTIARPPVYLPATLSVFEIVKQFRAAHAHVGLVLDEFGAIEGIVTSADILEGLVGELPSAPSEEAGPITRRHDGSYLVDGVIAVDDLASAIELPPIPEDEQGQYETLAGLVMTRLGRVPQAGDGFTWAHLRVEVVDMDGLRVDKVLITDERPTDEERRSEEQQS